jgi:hypothetical protein
VVRRKEQKMASSKLQETWWPSIQDQQTARKVARQAFWAAIVVAAITTVFAALAMAGTSLGGTTAGAFVDAAIFALVAIGIWKMSRTAAVAGLAIFALEKILMFQSLQKPGNLFVAIAILFGFANGVRATFAYHKLAAAEPTASDPAPLIPK